MFFLFIFQPQQGDSAKSKNKSCSLPATTNLGKYWVYIIELNFYLLEVVSRYRDPQPQVSNITYICTVKSKYMPLLQT